MRMRISEPNDCGSDEACQRAILDCYGFEGAESADDARAARAAAEADLGEAIQECLADCAKAAGLQYVAPTDFGAVWEGSPAQCKRARKLLPAWAYISEEEDS